MFIRRLVIERFRGIERLEWQPRQGLNCLIGPGDAGKSTVLAAVALLLDPRSAGMASEYDIHNRDLAQGFRIEGVLAGVEAALTGERAVLLHGWRDGVLQQLPEEAEGWEPVLVASVEAGPDLDIAYSLVTPDGERAAFSSALRARLMLARVASGERALGELRLGRGSLLDRAVRSEGIRPELAAALARIDSELQLPQTTTDQLVDLSGKFQQSGLPADLTLGLLSPTGQSLLGMLNLVSKAGVSPIPVALAGLGTRQLSLFTLASALMGDAPIIVIDEPESGLEPYRQRMQIRRLRSRAGDKGQVFLTTHSPTVLDVLEPSEIWRLTRRQDKPMSMDFVGGRVLKRPLTQGGAQAMLARLPIVGEGVTEVGLLLALLAPRAERDGLGGLDEIGIALVPLDGQPKLFEPVESLLAADVRVGVFIDNEKEHSGKRDRLAAHPLCAFGTWTHVRNIEEALATYLPWDSLPALIAVAAELRERGVESLLQEVGSAAGIDGKRTMPELAAAHTGGERAVREALFTAMAKNSWFKTAPQAHRLGLWLIEIGVPTEIDDVIERFWQAVQKQLR